MLRKKAKRIRTIHARPYKATFMLLGLADGATSLPEVAKRLREAADKIDTLVKEGIALDCEVAEDWDGGIEIATEDATVAAKYDMAQHQWDWPQIHLIPQKPDDEV